MLSRNFLLRISSVGCCLSFAFLILAADDTSPANIEKLQSEKLSILTDIVDRYQFAFSNGKPVIEELLAAEHELLSARLDVTDALEDRVKLMELILENRRRLVEVRTAGHKLGVKAEVEILHARVSQIDATIALTQERMQGPRNP